jgi:hypothetical protein
MTRFPTAHALLDGLAFDDEVDELAMYLGSARYSTHWTGTSLSDYERVFRPYFGAAAQRLATKIEGRRFRFHGPRPYQEPVVGRPGDAGLPESWRVRGWTD